MKLLRLKITDPKGFRSLQAGFEYHFRSEWDLQEEKGFAPFVCAGPNGSGKSNLLEVLAAIFYHLAQVSQPRTSSMRKMLCEIDLEKAQGYPGRYLEHFSKLRSCNSLRIMP